MFMVFLLSMLIVEPIILATGRFEDFCRREVLVPRYSSSGTKKTDEIRIAILVIRIFNYVFTMGQMIFQHIRKIFQSFRKGDLIKLQGIWTTGKMFLLIMLIFEPVIVSLSEFGFRNG